MDNYSKENRSSHLSEVVLAVWVDGGQKFPPNLSLSPPFRKTFLRFLSPFVRKHLYSWEERARSIVDAKRFAQQHNTTTR